MSAIIGVLARAVRHAGALATAGGEPLSAVTSRTPTFYSLLDTTSPTDESANNLTITTVGSGLTTESMNRGTGIRTNGTAHLEVPNGTPFISDTGATDETPESEFVAGGDFEIPATLSDDTVLLSMDDDEDAYAAGWSLRVHSDGSVEARDRVAWQPSSMRTPGSLVTVGVTVNIQIQLGRDGMMLWVAGRKADDGIKNGLTWFGIDQRHRNVSARNTSKLRIGATGTSGNTDIVASHVYAFARTGHTNAMVDADLEAMAGASGAVYAHRVWGANSTNPSPGTNVIQAAIDSMTPGGTVVLSAGTYTQSVDLNLKAGVEIVGQSSGSTIISLTNDSVITNALPVINDLAITSDITTATRTFTGTNSRADDDVVAVVNNAIFEDAWNVGTSNDNDNIKEAQLLPIRERTGSDITIDRQPQLAYPNSDRDGIGAFTPIVDVGMRGVTIRRTLSSGNTSVWQPEGIRRLRISDVVIEELGTGASAHGLGFSPLGCVDVWSDAEAPCSVRTEGPNDPVLHPYAIQTSACCGLVLHNIVGDSEEWHSYDQGGQNLMGEWSGTMPVGTAIQFLSTNCALVEATLYSRSGSGNGVRFPLHCHTGQTGHRFYWCHLPTGGGIGMGGPKIDIAHLTDSAGNLSELVCAYNSDSSYIYDWNSSNNAQTWFNAGSADGCSNCVFSDLHYPAGSPNSGTGTWTANTYRNVDAPNP